MKEKYCRSYALLSEETGVSVYELRAMHRLTRGREGCPFIGRSGGYPSAIHRWKRDHPLFVPSHQWPRKSPALPRTPRSVPAARATVAA